MVITLSLYKVFYVRAPPSADCIIVVLPRVPINYLTGFRYNGKHPGHPGHPV